MNTPPIIRHTQGGHYSTVRLSNGTVETLLFHDDGTEPTFVGRTIPEPLRDVAARHILQFEADQILQGS